MACACYPLRQSQAVLAPGRAESMHRPLQCSESAGLPKQRREPQRLATAGD
jgi:hypothetical protein